MHKYQPRVHIIKRPDEIKQLQRGVASTGQHHASKLQVTNDLESFEYKTFIFPETSFIAVTAYQNQLVIK